MHADSWDGSARYYCLMSEAAGGTSFCELQENLVRMPDYRDPSPLMRKSDYQVAAGLWLSVKER